MQKKHVNVPQRQLRLCRNKLKEKGVVFYEGKPLSYMKKKHLYKLFEDVFKVPFLEYWEKVSTAKEMRKQQNLDGDYVYFFVNEDYGFCKIGYSKNPLGRINELQTGCPFSLRILGFIEGDRKIEKKFHKRFWANRTRGEWFRYEGKLKQFCKDTFNGYYDEA
jgi:hypothetical protein